MLGLFVDFDPWWDNDLAALVVNEDVESDTELLAKLGIIIVICRRMLQWPKTRWCRSGKAGRLMVRSFGTGLDSHVQYVLKDKSISNSYISGYAEFVNDEVRHMFAVLAFSAKPFEHSTLQMLIDDRLLLHCERYHGEVLAHIRAMLDMPSLMWERVASAIGSTAGDLLHDVCMATCASYGYFVRDVLNTVYSAPFNLCIGDIAAKVAALASSNDDISNPYLIQIRAVLKRGMPETSVVEALNLLRDMPCSTALAEQGLAHGSVLMQKHGRYGENSLRVRSLLQASKFLVRRDVPPGVKLISLKLARLGRRQPQKTTGKCIHFSDNLRQVLPHRSEKTKVPGCVYLDNVSLVLVRHTRNCRQKADLS
jgi:hypothetical protein